MKAARLALAALGVAGALALSSRAHAQAPVPSGAKGATRPPLSASLTGPAKDAYEAGKVLFADGDAAGALAKFRQSHERSGDARLLWNMAVCEKGLRHYQRTRELIERYLREAPNVSTEERAQAQETLDLIARLVGKVKLSVSEDGAALSVDAEPASPVSGVLALDMGKHVIRAEKAGFQPKQETVDVPGGGEITLVLTLSPLSRQGTLMVHATDAATISVDGVVRGQGAWTGQVEAGPHALKLTAAGRKDYLRTVDVTPQATRSIDVTLEPAASRWPWIAGASVLVVGAGIGGYFLLRTPEEKTSPTRGTLDPGQVRLPLAAAASGRF